MNFSYTQASPVKAASVAHCLGTRTAHASHPLLPPPPPCLRTAATSCLSDLAVAMLQEEHAEKDAIGVVLDVATESILRMPLSRPVGPSQQVQLTGQGSWRTGKFKSCDDVAAASSIRDQRRSLICLGTWAAGLAVTNSRSTSFTTTLKG